MQLDGWIFMILSWAGILSVFFFCLVRTLRSKDTNGRN